MAEVIWSEAASEQLDEIIAYIEQFDPIAADQIAIRLYALSQSLSVFPNRGRPGPEDTREMATVPPYVLIYEVLGDRVVVLDVHHGRRQPRRFKR
ncbi:type II toxin-antitoxin system RelE/ParE family toxin [Sphingomonas sp.]|uniref:type II toxin-antitoxin system RelE/ParE family toxin n=1 Tax=Sphingomonas sp. TaxID=28214 RepID=UPI0035BC85A2